MKHFISCDWGTTSFRLRLVEAGSLKILAEIKNTQGVARLNEEFGKRSGDRFLFFRNILHHQLKDLERQAGYSLIYYTVIVSGMATSSIGMMELDYVPVPFRVDGSDFRPHIIPPSPEFNYTLSIITGARTANDAMRGEETILFGTRQKDQLFVFPGTHSKHVQVAGGMATDIHTYMTGELFALLAGKSILASSVEENSGTYHHAFDKGVTEALGSALLNNIFHVRTNRLFGYLSPPENYHFLSGLLIGAELKAIADGTNDITIFSEEKLGSMYLRAMKIVAPHHKVFLCDADEAITRGHERFL
jgi:2-dehydro-3-deoxygalactonokinase